MLLNPLFAAEEIERERQVILEEIKASQICRKIKSTSLYELLWPEHPGRSILGTESSISQVTQEDLIAYYRQHYTPDQVVIAAAGNIEHQALVDQFAREFDALNQNLRKADICLAKPTPTHSQIYTVAKDLEQVHICCGGSGLNRSDPNLETLRLLDTLVGGGMSSRLFQELRKTAAWSTMFIQIMHYIEMPENF